MTVNDLDEAPTPEPTPEPATESAPESVPTSSKGISNLITTIDNLFSSDVLATFVRATFELSIPLKVGNKDVSALIAGSSIKDKITGTSGDEVLAGGRGKDVLKGGDGADGFLFQDRDGFGKKMADKIKDFDSDEGDSILVDQDFFGLGEKIKLKSHASKNKVKKAAKSKNDFVYDEKKGLLYFNENGKEKGWGDGGLFAKLQGAPELGADDFTIVSDWI